MHKYVLEESFKERKTSNEIERKNTYQIFGFFLISNTVILNRHQLNTIYSNPTSLLIDELIITLLRNTYHIYIYEWVRINMGLSLKNVYWSVQFSLKNFRIKEIQVFHFKQIINKTKNPAYDHGYIAYCLFLS